MIPQEAFAMLIAAVCLFSAAACLAFARRFDQSSKRWWRAFQGVINLYFAGLAITTAFETLPRIQLVSMLIQPAFILLFLWPGLEAYIDWKRNVAN